ncbi:hypothetical protein BSL78_02267 [Apostichopus japonicus]|uniref:TNFR-Cys domain-containing protein n=1 Tax=Stichopus japonicus TaxID=307972 RepID=A0A2G8LKK2_STIJA|nr:hypothetical protein BSL78_02267 [Apostichopus japonicus]
MASHLQAYRLGVLHIYRTKGCDELDYNTDYTEVCKGSTLTYAYCPPGKRLTDPCEGSCDYCPNGQYQNSYNTCETCRNCTTRADCDKCDGHKCQTFAMIKLSGIIAMFWYLTSGHNFLSCSINQLIGECRSNRNAKCGCPTCPTCETCPTPPEGNIPPTQEDTTHVVSCPPVEPCPPVVPCPPVETCPPVQPCPSASPLPDKEPLGSCNDRVHKWWRIWGIIALIIFPLLLLGYPVLCFCKRKVPQPKGYKGNDPAARNDSQGSGPGGSGSTHDATPPEGSDQGPSPPQGAEGGDPSPGITSESSTNQEGMTSGPEADGGDVKLTVVLPTDESDQGPSSIQGSEGGDPPPGSQLQFSNAAIGNVLITEEEINDVADEVYKHFGTKIKSLDRFFSKLGIPFQDYKRMLEDTTSTGINDKLFDVIMRWHGEAPQTKEAIRKGLYKNHEQLGIWYVGYVNNGPVTDQQ